jgi:hypothetical protein
MRRRVEQTTIPPNVYKMFNFVIGFVAFIGGILSALVGFSFWFGKNVATIPYVDGRHKEAMEYVDARTIQVRDQAYDHADMNKKDLMGEIKAQGSDIKALGAKQDVMLDTVRVIQSQMFETRKR